ncbi:hypothetical protein CFC21_046370 [Triticum aestivum]|uniref:F-box domain-containing protein n=5 Tax=Triticinae TaxID=1648030 RepID=A0A9R1FUA9_WHEAT|nr:uncharacterized protein LOC123077537 [Triticum aestivum]KAF7035501.1 hypothetical protein CFC21_046369 [Triticum aestivum]KAF7035502.1 hypothetical protein CFC21_046370 [Triticum aestivum]
MEQSDGPKRPKLADAADGDEDRLSVLPDDILIHILVKLRGTPMAARTSVLCRRWRDLWKLLPELNFPLGTEPHRIRSALTAHEAPVIHFLVVDLQDAAAESVATWVPIIAPRLFGELFIFNLRRDWDGETGTVELPCFQGADWISLDLDNLGLALPPSGVFAWLTDLCLVAVRMRGSCRLGDIVSSPRCPSLRKLILRDAQVRADIVIHSESLLEIGMDNVLLDHNALGPGILAISSESVLQIDLKNLIGVRQLLVMAPALISLKEKDTTYIADPVDPSQPVANISAPQLTLLEWNARYDRRSVQLGKMAHLQWLHAGQFLVYGSDEDFAHNRIRLLQRFEFIICLDLALYYRKDMSDHQRYLMEDMPRLPYILFLSINVAANEHSFGASLFHVLRLCTGVRKLTLAFDVSTRQLEAQTTCSLGCICHQPPNWKTDELLLSHLVIIEISAWRGTENEVAFVERLLNWATVLKEMMITFHQSVTESNAEDLCQTLLSFSRPETCMKFYVYRGLYAKVPYVPEG